jgi:anti-sigma B factor antagonist
VELKESSYRVVSRFDQLALAERDADRTVVWLRGEHDASTVAALWDAIGQAIATDDTDVVVDLSGVDFMGSATVGVIIRARESIRPRALTLRSPSRCAQRVLDLYGLAHLLDDRPVDATCAPWADVADPSTAGRDGP